jgi:hypothetical protein
MFEQTAGERMKLVDSRRQPLQRFGVALQDGQHQAP